MAIIDTSIDRFFTGWEQKTDGAAIEGHTVSVLEFLVGGYFKSQQVSILIVLVYM